MTGNNLFVITGGPGVGKTSLINALESKGFQVVPEAARKIIKEQLRIKGECLPWKNKAHYAELMLDLSMRDYRNIAGEPISEAIFFDRGILDTVCYMTMEAIPIPEALSNILKTFRYNNKVFILPPWREIYETDNERRQTWSEAIFIFGKMKQTYQDYGYEVIEVPKGNIEQRCKFVEHEIQ